MQKIENEQLSIIRASILWSDMEIRRISRILRKKPEMIKTLKGELGVLLKRVKFEERNLEVWLRKNGNYA